MQDGFPSPNYQPANNKKTSWQNIKCRPLTPEFEPLTLVVRVDKMVRDINTVILVPEVLSTVMDDSILSLIHI